MHSGIDLPRAQTSRLLKQRGIILIENETKVSQHQKKIFKSPSGSQRELLKLYKLRMFARFNKSLHLTRISLQI